MAESPRSDRYAKLRPPPPTPAEQLCTCDDRPPIKLMAALTYNPIHCLRCHGEVPPERLELADDLVELLADWRDVYGALDLLWLDSGPYELWAARELQSLTSPANEAGLKLRAELNPIRRCYYWLFRDFPAILETDTGECPGCGQPMLPYPASRPPQRICEACSFVTGVAEIEPQAVFRSDDS